MKRYLLNPWIIGAVVVIIALIGYFSSKGNAAQNKEETIVVKSGTVSQVVSVTGKVKSANTVDLSFEKSGRVTAVKRDIGQRVTTGEIIVATDNSDLIAQLKQAQASVQFQQAKLAALKSGTRPEELTISQSKVTNAQNDVVSAQNDLISSLQTAYTTAEDSIHNKIDELFVNPRTTSPHLNFVLTVPQTGIESGRVEVENRIQDLQTITASASTTDALPQLSSSVKQDLAEIKLFLDNTALAVNALLPTSSLTQTTINQWKSDLSLARTNVNTAITAILANDEKLKSNQNAVIVAQHQLDLEKAGSISQDVDAQQAQVAQAQATVDGIYSQLAKTYVRSPLNGIITKQDAKIGQLVSANTNIVSIISDSKFQIEANIPEADVAKVKIGNIAKVTLDAYGPDVPFDVVIVKIDPAETIVDGVPTYKTTFQFEAADDRIKSGMTANIDIIGETHDNVLNVPQRAIISHDGQKFVTVKSGTTTAEVQIKTGIRGSDGAVEITDGLSEGQTILINQAK